MEENVFLTRVIESKIFNQEEINTIQKGYILYEKCYLLGVLDTQ